jgi:hypothetical protein
MTSLEDKKLITFLKDLTGSLERKELSTLQKKRVGEFFMSYQFQECAVQDSDESLTDTQCFSQSEMMKFLSLGWYIYQVILQEGSLPLLEEDDVD